MRFTTLGCMLVAGTICLAAQAQPLTIHNNTDFPSTTRANGGPCSNILSDGITQAHSTNVVKEGSLRVACIKNTANCKADVYLTNNCTGAIIGNATFSIKTGMISANANPASKYCLKINGPFEITMDLKDSPACQ